MNKKEYKEYKARVEQFLENEGIHHLSAIADENGDYEEYFSWKPCDCCGDTLGGNRIDCNSYNPELREIVGPYRICTDCYYYAEYGRLDDMTMMEIEETV